MKKHFLFLALILASLASMGQSGKKITLKGGSSSSGTAAPAGLADSLASHNAQIKLNAANAALNSTNVANNTTAIALKAPLASPVFTGTVKNGSDTLASLSQMRSTIAQAFAPVRTAFVTKIPFKNFTTIIDQKVLTQDTTFTYDSVGATAGYTTMLRLVGNGVASINVSAFKLIKNSQPYDATDGVVNLLSFLYDGTDYTVMINQVNGGTINSLVTPAAPTNYTIDETNKTIGWTPTPGYANANLYEISFNNGFGWVDVPANPYTFTATSFAAGVVKIRVKATASNNSGSVLANANPYPASLPTPSAPTAGVVNDTYGTDTYDWTNNSSYTAVTDYEYTTNGGTSYTTCSAKPIVIGDVALASGQVGVRVKATSNNYASATLYSTAAFTQNPTAPTVSTGSSSSVTNVSAVAAGTISSTGTASVTAYGIEYSTTSGFTSGSGTKVASSNLSGSAFSSTLSSLTASTTYYFRAYATSTAGTGYGSQATFTTSAAATPTLSASAISAFGNVCTGATATNSFTLTGTSLTSANVTVTPPTGFTLSTDNSTFSASLTLTPSSGSISQTVYVKFAPSAVQSYDGNIAIAGGGASSINAAVTGSGVNSAPTVSTGASSSVTSTGATLAGTLSSAGCTTVSAYGIEYSTTTGFTAGTGTKVAASNLSGSAYSVTLSGLSNSTTYYYIAYATNSAGTTYGTQSSFTTSGTSQVVLSSAGGLSSGQGSGFGGSNLNLLGVTSNTWVTTAGTVNTIKFYLKAVPAGTMTSMDINVWRKNGSNTYDRIGTVNVLVSAMVSGNNTVTVSSPFSVQVGDYVGLSLSGTCTNSPFATILGSGTQSRYALAAVGGTTGIDWDSKTSDTKYYPIQLLQ